MTRTLETIDEPTTKALTTVERVMMESAIFAGGDPQLIAAKILEASSDIAIRVAPTLYRTKVLETIFRDASCWWFEWLDPTVWPITSIDSIVVDGVEIDPVRYMIDRRRRRIHHAAPAGWFGAPYGWPFRNSIEITYTGGYLLPGQPNRDLPPSLEGACLDLVSSAWHARGRDPTLRAETNVGVYEFQYWTGSIGESGSLPPLVESKIEPYKSKEWIW